MRTDLEGAKDRVLRSQAELENYRKRAAREIDEHRRYANLPLLSDLLPVLDNIERAVAAADKSHDAASLLEGIKMVLQQFDGVLDATTACGSTPCTSRSIRTCTRPFRSSPARSIRPTRCCLWSDPALNCSTAWCGRAR